MTSTRKRTSRTQYSLRILLLVVLSMLLSEATVQAQPNLNFKRATVNWPTIELYFSVGCNGNPAYNMTKQDFAIYDDGQEIKNFTLWCPDPTVRCAISVSLVFDASGSMAGNGNSGAKLAGHAFIDLMDGVVDEAAIVWFTQVVTVYQQMTTVKPMLHSAVDALPANGATAVWDGIYAGIIELINNGVNQCRAVLVMTDGGDNSSTRTVAEIISLAHRHRIRVFTIGLGSAINATELEQIALLTGGRYYQTPNAGQLAAIYQEISTIIFQGFQECIVTYEQSCADGKYHSVELQLRNFCGGTDVKTKTYLAPFDSTTFGTLNVSIDNVDAPIPGTAIVPIRISGDPNPVTLPKFDCTVLYDPNKLEFIGLRANRPDQLDASSVTVTSFSGGVRLESQATFVRSSDILTSLEFKTKTDLSLGPCTLVLNSFVFSSSCITAITGDGLVTALSGQHPSISRWPAGALKVYCNAHDSVDVAFEVRNLGSAELQILNSGFAPGTGQKWRLLKPLGNDIASGMVNHVHLRYFATDPATEDYDFVVESNDPVQPSMSIPIRVFVFANSQVRMRAIPTSLDFGQVQANAEMQLPLTVRNDGGFTIGIDKEEIIGPDAQYFSIANWLPPSFAVGAQGSATIALKSSVPGMKYAQYVVHYSAGATLSVPLFGWIGDPEPHFVVNPNVDTLAFAATVVNGSREQTLQLLNRGSLALTVTSISISGPQANAYFLVGSAPITLAPGEQRSITVRFSPRSVGVQRASLLIQTTDPAHASTTIHLRGEGYIVTQPKAALSTNSLNFGAIPVGTYTRKSVYLSNTGNATLQVSGQSIILDDSGSYAIRQIARSSLPSGQGDSITVEFLPQSAGWRSGALRIFTNDPDKTEIQIQLLGEGVAAPPAEITITPSQLDFGAVPVDTLSVLQLSIYNTGGSPLRVLDQRITGNDAALFQMITTIPHEIAPGGSASVSMGFRPQSKGTKSAALTIASNDPLRSSVNVLLLGFGTEAPPAMISLQETYIDFGSIPIGQSAQKPFLVINIGGQPLLMNEQVISGRDADVFAIVRALPSSIAPGTSNTAELRFFAMRSGNALGSFSFKTNDPLKPTVDVALFANATITAVDRPAAFPSNPEILAAYPNPAASFTNITVDVPLSGRGDLLLFDNLGRLVRKLDVGWLEAGTNTVHLSKDGLPAGAYTITLQIAGHQSQPALLVVM